MASGNPILDSKSSPAACGSSLRNRFNSAKSLVTQALNTYTDTDCDVVVQLPKGAKDLTVQWLCNKISTSKTGLSCNVRKHGVSGLTNIICSAKFESLLNGAEELNLKKKLEDRYGGQLREFFTDDAHMYEGIESPATFFTSQERQHITLHLLNNIRVKTPHECIQGHRFIRGQAIVPRMVTTELIKQVYPLHNKGDLEELVNGWVFDITAPQPLDKIKDYYGVQIGMYFAFLGHYTMALSIPAVIGLIIWLYSGTNQAQDDICFVVFGVLNVIWSTIYMELWKRKEAEHAYKWGTLDKQDDLITEPRPLYVGEFRESPVTGRLEPVYPKWKRNMFFYGVSIPVMFICHCFIVLVCFNFFSLYDAINDSIKSGQLSFIFKPVPNIFLAMAIMIMDKVYGKIAVWLNDNENYRSEEEYKNQLIVKLMVFQSANSFLSLFYTAFYIQDFNRLRNQLAVLFVVRQVVGNMKESLLSYFIAKFKQFQGASGAGLLHHVKQFKEVAQRKVPEKENDSKMEDLAGQVHCKLSELTQAEAEGMLPQYDGTFEDYLEMVIQFSYVTWFSSVFPLAGLFALLNNVMEIRSDAFKICMSFQRPFGVQVRNIGAWQTVLEVMSIFTIIVNTALIGISGPMQRIFPDLSSTQRLLLIVVMEHLVLGLKFAIRMAISDVPDWVSIEMAKLEFNRREALRGLQGKSGQMSSPSSPGAESTDTTDPTDDLDVKMESHSTASSARASPLRDPTRTNKDREVSPLITEQTTSREDNSNDDNPDTLRVDVQLPE